jgi:hypothetical protein
VLPPGAITGDDDQLSVTAPSPARFVAGSTPRGCRRDSRLESRSAAASPHSRPERHSLMKTSLHDATHFLLRSGANATRYA